MLLAPTMPAAPTVAHSTPNHAVASANTKVATQTLSVARSGSYCNPNRVDCPPSISFREFRAVLLTHHTRLSSADVAFAWQQGVSTGIDPAYFLAFACKESLCGGDNSPVTVGCRNIGDMVTGDSNSPCPANPRYRSYASYHAAIADWYSHVRRNYVDVGIVYIWQVVPRYYGNVNKEYLNEVTTWVAEWRREDRNR